MTNGVSTLRVYLDEDVDVLLVRLLAVHGFDVVTAAETGHLGWTDESHLEFAAADARVLITHNRVHFERLAAAWWQQKKPHAGIVLAIRRANTYLLARHLLPVLRTYDQAGWQDCMLYA